MNTSMNTSFLLRSFWHACLVGAIIAVYELPVRAHDLQAFIAELGPVTRTAISSYKYTQRDTWADGVVPGENDVVEIPAGITVTVNTTNPIAKTVIVRGKLRFSHLANSTLRVETLVVDDGGSLAVGDNSGDKAIPENLTATIIIRDLGTITQDTNRLARGIIASHQATVRMNSGKPRAPFVTFSGDLLPANTSNNLFTTSSAPASAVPATWRVGDEIVIPATVFTREWQDDMQAAGTARLQNELRSIATIAADRSSFTLNAPLTYSHQRAVTDVSAIRIHAANLTRNIVIRSENTNEIARFGHAMFMGSDVELNGVAFINMGRTAKHAIVTDPTLPDSFYNGRGTPTPFSNPRGRYACHFHKGGTAANAPVAVVKNCLVRGTPGWGFVNHAANVDFTDNVAFDFDGAGFVAEDGDEIGSFTRNIAIGGRGNGEFPGVRSVFGNPPRMDQGDMAFTGDGFWLQSPDVTVSNNIAAGCKGVGFFFWTSGRLDPGASGAPHYTGRPLTRALPTGARPRRWDYDLDGTCDAVIIGDIPLAGCSGNIAYGCFMGMKIRFVNQSNANIFEVRDNQPPLLDIKQEIVKDPAGTALVRFPISNCTFWNNLYGMHASYLTKCDFSDITIIATGNRAADPGTNQPPYSQDRGLGAIGIDFHHVNLDCTLTNVIVKNYTTGLWRNGNNVASNGITFGNCTQNVEDTVSSKGYDWFFMVFDTDNRPDDPQ